MAGASANGPQAAAGERKNRRPAAVERAEEARGASCWRWPSPGTSFCWMNGRRIRIRISAASFTSPAAADAGRWAKPCSPSAMTITTSSTPIVCWRCALASSPELTGEERNRLPAMRWPVRPDSQRAPGKARAPLKFSASTSLTVIISPPSRYA